MQELAQSGDLYIQCSKLHPTCAQTCRTTAALVLAKGASRNLVASCWRKPTIISRASICRGAQERGCKLTFEIGIPDPFPSYTLIKVKLAQDRAVGE